MAESRSTCGRPGAEVSGTATTTWGYKTKAGAQQALRETAIFEQAELDALTEALWEVSCDNPTCPKRGGVLTEYSTTTNVHRGFWNWLFGLLGAKPWKAQVISTYEAEVWCRKSRQAVKISGEEWGASDEPAPEPAEPVEPTEPGEPVEPG